MKMAYAKTLVLIQEKRLLATSRSALTFKVDSQELMQLTHLTTFSATLQIMLNIMMLIKILSEFKHIGMIMTRFTLVDH